MNTENLVLKLLGLLAAGMFFSSCQAYRNFTTYYNRFWNMERIMAEVEDEVDYYRDQQGPPQPRYYVPYDELRDENFFSEHLNRRTLEPQEVKDNKIKLDSIILKGSLLLSRQAESDYVDDAVFYISKAYFYMREWYQSQEQALSLIKNFPDSKWQPDAHLIVAMDLLKQGDVEEAEKMLSRTVDVAFRFKRQDVLTEAFRLNADAQLAQGNPGGAIRPYERAILLSESDEEQARWQYEIGVVHFRAREFEKAVEAFDKVGEYDPDDLTKFETGLQRSVALRTLKRYDEADAQLNELAEEEDFKEWQGVVSAEKLSLASDQAGSGTFSSAELAAVDSAGGKDYAMYGVYERGVRSFLAGDYQTSLANFTIVQTAKTPFQRKAHHYTVWLTYYNEQQFQAQQATRIPIHPFPDSLAQRTAASYYNVARFFVTFDVNDSIEHYYRLSMKWAPKGSIEAARVLYALSSFVRREGNGVEADSLLDVLATEYGDNEYAREARKQLGYTDNFLIDPAKELYLSGRSSMQNAADYPRALEKFGQVVREYSFSEYAPAALYASGLIFEQYLNNPDSALFYYAQLLERYPESIQAKSVRGLVDATLAARTGAEPKDGLVALDGGNQQGKDTAVQAQDPVVAPPVAEATPWYEATLYDPVPELAMQRRGKRTTDRK